MTRQNNHAALYCSTSDFAFGPIFSDSQTHEADERAAAFCRWLMDDAPNWAKYEKESTLFTSRRDPRELSSVGLERAYIDWLHQEDRQYQRERLSYLTKDGENDLEPEEMAEIASLRAALASIETQETP